MKVSLKENSASNLGVRRMDDEYARMMDMMNELLSMLLSGAKRGEEFAKLNALIRFTGIHFQTEEQLMKLRGFPGLVEYRIEHRRMLRKLENAVTMLQHDESVNIDALRSFLYEWFIDRVDDLDKQYDPSLARHSVRGLEAGNQ